MILKRKYYPSFLAALKECKYRDHGLLFDVRSNEARECVKGFVHRFLDGSSLASSTLLSNLALEYRFLLVKFHVEYICQQATRKQIKDALVKLKSSSTEKRPLDPTYDRVMRSIDAKPKSCKELAIKILSWLVHAQRTLTVKEAQTAVSVELYRYEIDEQDLLDRATLLETCPGLVAIDDHGTGDTIRLAHYTIQEYLPEKSIIPSDAAFAIAMTCVTFLSFDEFSLGACKSKHSLQDRLQKYPFFGYAARNLHFHLRKCGGLGDGHNSPVSRKSRIHQLLPTGRLSQEI